MCIRDRTFTVEKGDGIFPTGKTITFSPEKKNMLDGLAAIEFRSWYGGENVICATAAGVKSAKICIFADGEPKPKNTVLNPMLPPPYTVGEPKPCLLYTSCENVWQNKILRDRSVWQLPQVRECVQSLFQF